MGVGVGGGGSGCYAQVVRDLTGLVQNIHCVIYILLLFLAEKHNLMILPQELANPSYKHIFAVAAALYDSAAYSMERLSSLTRIDPWFLWKMNNIITMIKKLSTVDYKVYYMMSLTMSPGRIMMSPWGTTM